MSTFHIFFKAAFKRLQDQLRDSNSVSNKVSWYHLIWENPIYPALRRKINHTKPYMDIPYLWKVEKSLVYLQTQIEVYF